MADQTDVIKMQMEETRESLSEKIGALEDHVLGTVQGTTEAVSQTVEKVAETVQSTVSAVKEEVEKSVETVKRTFDLRLQVEQHPWAVMAGSVMLGYVVEGLLEARPAQTQAATYPSADYSAATARPAFAPSAPAAPGWFDKLAEQFEPALSKLRSTALGAGVGFVGQMLMDAAPPDYRDPLKDIIDQVANALGTKPLFASKEGEQGSSGHAHNGFSREEAVGGVG